MRKKTLRDLDVAGKRVLVRADLNVSFVPGTNTISDDSRIQAILPTLHYLKYQGASIILCSHLGRPSGQIVEELRLAPVAVRLNAFLGEPVIYVRECVGSVVQEAAMELEAGRVLLLENLRFHPEEEKNDPVFAEALGAIAEVYVNDAFGASHRAHASIDAITHYLPAVAGLQMERELEMLGTALEDPPRPLAAVLGGAKVSDKIVVLESLLLRVDQLFIGGGMAATFLRAQGYQMGRSLVEVERISVAGDILNKAESLGITVQLPEDLVVSQAFTSDAPFRVVSIDQIPEEGHVMDIGPATIAAFAQELQGCRTVVWNGPMGVFEFEPFASGTKAIAETLAYLSSATTVVGGGSTAEAVKKLELTASMNHVSMGGGASLEFLEGRELPGVAALMDREGP